MSVRPRGQDAGAKLAGCASAFGFRFGGLTGWRPRGLAVLLLALAIALGLALMALLLELLDLSPLAALRCNNGADLLAACLVQRRFGTSIGAALRRRRQTGHGGLAVNAGRARPPGTGVESSSQPQPASSIETESARTRRNIRLVPLSNSDVSSATANTGRMGERDRPPQTRDSWRPASGCAIPTP